MAIAMVAMLAFGGTYAYFTSGPVTAQLDKTSTLGTIKLDDTATLASTSLVQNVLPTEKLFGASGTTLTVKDMSNRTSYIFVTVSYTITKTDDSTVAADDLPDLTFTDGDFKAANTVTDGDKTVYWMLTTAVDAENGKTYTISGINVEIPEEWDNTFQGAEITLSFEFKSIQEAGFSSAADAYAQWLEDGGKKTA